MASSGSGSCDTVSSVSRDQPTVSRPTLIPILQVWKVGPREVKSLARGPRAKTWQIQSQECPTDCKAGTLHCCCPAALHS